MENPKPQNESPKKSQATNSPQKRPHEEDQSIDDEQGTQSTSRTGRVRKPKVFFDPSVVEQKRKSMPNMEIKKPEPKKAKSNEEASKRDKDSAAAGKDKAKTKRLTPSQITASAINKRRQTFAVAFDNGCIVCSRNDILKGRFVNCTECIKRGHFTCLRTGKLFKTADTEKTWQCPSCKHCESCGEQEPIDDLVKCITCYNSYHPQCLKLNPKTVVRKRFICEICTRVEAKHEKADAISAAKSVPVKRSSSNGFAGFTCDESTKKTDNQPPSSKSKKLVTNNDDNISDLNVKSEPKTPTSDAEPFTSTGRHQNNENKISVRKDLVENDDDIDGDNVHGLDDDGQSILYDTKTAITPHESIPDVREWNCDEVYTYFVATTRAEFANVLKENQIDGDALLLIRREDVLNRFNLKLGPALRLYAHIVSLQYKNNNPILAWNDY